VAVIVVLVIIATLIHIIKWRKPTENKTIPISDAESLKQEKTFGNGAYVACEEDVHPMKKNGTVLSNGQGVKKDESDVTKNKPADEVSKQNDHVDTSFSDDEYSGIYFEKGNGKASFVCCSFFRMLADFLKLFILSVEGGGTK